MAVLPFNIFEILQVEWGLPVRERGTAVVTPASGRRHRLTLRTGECPVAQLVQLHRRDSFSEESSGHQASPMGPSTAYWPTQVEDGQ
jgi:hypothetical protein